MQVTVSWQETVEDARYWVTAKTRAEAVQEMEARPDQEWATFKGTIVWKAPTNTAIRKLALLPGYTIEMPSWKHYQKQSESDRRDWREMKKALFKHEQGHKKIFKEGVSRMQTHFQDLQQLEEAELRAQFERLLEVQKERQLKYDVETEKGVLQGVRF